MTESTDARGEPDQFVERPEVEFLILADHSEAVNGKLYLMGGGWDRRAVGDFHQPQTFAVAVGVLIPWNDTNRPIPLGVSLRNADGTLIAPALQTQLTAGRPANATPGQKLRYMLAVNLQILLPRPGEYVVEAQVGASPTKHVSFFADALPSQAGR
jgi:hypothetical protein